jgi:recombination endonuclease VII
MPLTAEQRAAKNARRRERRAKEPEYRAKENARCRDYYQAHKQKICEGARARYQPRLCGLSATEYDALLAKQNGACAICRRRWKERLCVDHCHLTGTIRGLLRACNLVLGALKDDQASLVAALVSRRAAPRRTRLRRAARAGRARCAAPLADTTSAADPSARPLRCRAPRARRRREDLAPDIAWRGRPPD